MHLTLTKDEEKAVEKMLDEKQGQKAFELFIKRCIRKRVKHAAEQGSCFVCNGEVDSNFNCKSGCDG